MEDIELRDVKVAKDFYVPKDKVKYYAAYSGEFIINDVRKMRKTEPGKLQVSRIHRKLHQSRNSRIHRKLQLFQIRLELIRKRTTIRQQ